MSDLAPLKEINTLQTLHMGLNTDRKNRAAATFLGIPGGYGQFEVSLRNGTLTLEDGPKNHAQPLAAA